MDILWKRKPPVTPPDDDDNPEEDALPFRAVHSLSVGDDFTLSGCEEYSVLDNIVECEITGDDIDTDIPGTYFVEYKAKDANGNEDHFFVIVMVLSEYYDEAAGLSGNDLLQRLRLIINSDVNRLSYDDAKTILAESDRDPNNENNVIQVYTGNSVPGSWDYGNWNREHVWPQSRMEGISYATSDIHNLKPVDKSENSRRGNKYFSNITDADAYAPRDEVKGDIARILFYMTVMYDELELVNNVTSGHYMGYLDILVEWHREDAVDEFERNRNEVLYSYQNNRNPFIDYPLFYDLIQYPELLKPITN